MQLAVRGKNIEITNALREYLERKVGRIEKFIDQPISAQVNMYVERGRHIVEVTAALNGLLLRGEEATNDMYASIDLVSDKLEAQVKKYKARFERRGKENGTAEPVESAEGDGRLVKTKHFPVKPLNLEEAIVQMNLLSHDFFVFANADTERINVLYRRKDGDYGLLEPEQ
ncbi:MAG: ribosome hibernation-promoting factor, HPF/YfiA family [Mycobacterium leprae]